MKTTNHGRDDYDLSDLWSDVKAGDFDDLILIAIIWSAIVFVAGVFLGANVW
jgi:hypothetical protein